MQEKKNREGHKKEKRQKEKRNENEKTKRKKEWPTEKKNWKKNTETKERPGGDMKSEHRYFIHNKLNNMPIRS